MSESQPDKPSRTGREVLDDYRAGKPLRDSKEYAFIRRLKDEVPWMFIDYRTGGSSGRIRRED